MMRDGRGRGDSSVRYSKAVTECVFSRRTRRAPSERLEANRRDGLTKSRSARVSARARENALVKDVPNGEFDSSH